MKIAAKCSMHNGKKMSRRHNTRDYDTDRWNTDGHVHPDRQPLNQTIIDKDRRQVFDDTFGDALVAFNAKERAKHPDRLIGFTSPQQYDKATPAERRQKAVSAYYKEHGKDCQETIIQLGDGQVYADMCARYGQERADNLYSQFLRSMVEHWQQDNPALQIFGAYIHMDETTPHLHMDWMPVKESDRGLSTAFSIEGALKAQGYTRKKSEKYAETPYKRWLADSRLKLESYAQEFCDAHRLDVVIVPAEKSTHRHKDTAIWREEQQQAQQAQDAVSRLTAPKKLTDRLNPVAAAARADAAQYIISHAHAAATALTAQAEQERKDAHKAMQDAQGAAQDAARQSARVMQQAAAMGAEMDAVGATAARSAAMLSRLTGYIPEGRRMVDRLRADRLHGRLHENIIDIPKNHEKSTKIERENER